MDTNIKHDILADPDSVQATFRCSTAQHHRMPCPAAWSPATHTHTLFLYSSEVNGPRVSSYFGQNVFLALYTLSYQAKNSMRHAR